MFTNLVESSSHAKEFKRRGSFVLFTTVTYAVLMVVMGVVSIYAYDARLEEQSLEIVTLINPQEIAPEPAAEPERSPDPGKNDNNNNESNIPTRAIAMSSVNQPENVPESVSTTPNKNLPLPDRGPVSITGVDYNPPGGGGGPGVPGTGRSITPPRQVIDIEDPPPAPEAPKTPKVVHRNIINGSAISLPRPIYPPAAKQLGIQGVVSVQVLIDESGKVISATPVGGSPFLRAEAQKAAYQARFSPTVLNDQPVRVSGVITYNFVLNR